MRTVALNELLVLIVLGGFSYITIEDCKGDFGISQMNATVDKASGVSKHVVTLYDLKNNVAYNPTLSQLKIIEKALGKI